MELKNRCREIILGSLLGDGSLKIGRKYKNARICFRHSISQKDYFFWKVSELKEISGKKCSRVQPADGWSKKKKLHYCSRAHPLLTELYYLTHRQGKTYIHQEWLRGLTSLSLLVWWLDDGSLVKNSRQGILCTEGFSRQDLLVLSRYLKQRWRIKTQVGRRGKYYQLRI